MIVHIHVHTCIHSCAGDCIDDCTYTCIHSCAGDCIDDCTYIHVYTHVQVNSPEKLTPASVAIVLMDLTNEVLNLHVFIYNIYMSSEKKFSRSLNMG